MKGLIKRLLREGLLEEEFKYMDLDSANQDDIYNVFKQSYEKHTGTSWDKGKFQGRATNWLFFGDETGFITVRPQRSGFYKLVGVAGNMKGVIKGMNELKSKNYPIWGMVSADLKGLAQKQGFKTPPTFLLKLLLKVIPKSVFGDVDFIINSDGSVTLKYNDVGDAKKYFVANNEYFKKLKSDILPTISDKMSDLPSIIKIGLNKFLSENMILENNDELLNEDITSGSVIVYHRTGKNGESPVKGIASDGYRIGGGAMYGPGVYTTYNFESQLNSRMVDTYGSIIIESKIKSIKNFLIFDYDVAKRVYGNKNYTLDKQLRIILGGKFDKYKNDIDLKNLIEKLPIVKYTSDVTNSFVNKYPDIVNNVSGLVFTGQNDGNVLVCYDRKNVEPIRYTMDEGKTWVNILDKNIYKRIKGYNPEENNINVSHIENKLDVKQPLTNAEIDILLSNEKLISKLDSDGIEDLLNHSNEPEKVINILGEKGNIFISNLDSNGIRHLLSYSTEPEKVINMLGEKGNIFISNLDSNGIKYLIGYSKEPEKVINILLSNERVISNLNSNGIHNLLKHSNEPEKVINMLGEKGNIFISNLDSNGIYYLISSSKEPEKVINILGEKGKEHISKLNSFGIENLISYSKEKEKVINILLSNERLISNLNLDGIKYLLSSSKEKEKVINMLLSNEGFISNLDSTGIYYLVSSSKEKEKVIDILLSNERVISNLDSNGIYYLISSSKEPEKVINILGEKGKEHISNLDSNGIYYLLKYSKEPEKIRDLLKKYGHKI